MLTVPAFPCFDVVFPGTYKRLIVTNASLCKDHSVNKGRPLEKICLLTIKSRKARQTYDIGTLAKVIRQEPFTPTSKSLRSLLIYKRLQWSSQDVTVIEVQGTERFRLVKLSIENGGTYASIELLKDNLATLSPNLTEDLRILATKYITKANETDSGLPEILEDIAREDDLALLGFKAAKHLKLSIEEKQGLLEEVDLVNRTANIMAFLKVITNDVKNKKGELHRALKKMKPFEDMVDEVDILQSKLNSLELLPETKEYIQRELTRMQKLSQISPERQIAQTYLETVIGLPWNAMTTDNYNLEEAQTILDRDHFGLDKVKQRIIEHLAVKALKGGMKGSILCLRGPPGVGKTSLGKSIAEALGRKFIRISLGGVRDEAEIRGHRRTYVGAMPGSLLTAIRTAGTKNPVILLDEIDKVGRDSHRGDVSSALLEVLDPCQNHTFKDNYIAIPFDLSNVLFIATANSLEPIAAPLLDRMEVIELTGYVLQEKLEIACAYLVKRQVEECGIPPNSISFPKQVLRHVIANYTREAGVRQLERSIGSICRAVAVQVSKAKARGLEFAAKVVTEEDVEEVLGLSDSDDGVKLQITTTGVALGLGWTPHGGIILLVETAKSPGSGQLTITGQLGKVMNESVNTALSLIKCSFQSTLPALSSQNKGFEGTDLHIHFPAAAVPKDGPSAGVTIFTALMSLLLDVKVRGDTAMTGEISLKGQVLPVGGIKEKVLAAHRQGLKRVILPVANLKHLKELPESVKQEIEFIPVLSAQEVLVQALEACPALHLLLSSKL